MTNQMTTEQAVKNDVFSSLRDEKVKNELSLVLPNKMDIHKFTRLFLSEVSKNPKLNKCVPREFMLAVSTIAQLGLEVGAALGHAYILPYENKKKNKIEPQVIIGYRGMIDLARRSGQIVSIESRVVYEKDRFEVEFGLNSKLVHVPNFDCEDRGQVRFAYAVAHLVGGGYQFEVVGINEIKKIIPKHGSNVWDNHFDEMAKKTVIRRLFKMLPISTEMSRAVSLDDAASADISQIEIIDNEAKNESQSEIDSSQKISIKPIAQKTPEQAPEQAPELTTDQAPELTPDQQKIDESWDVFKNGDKT